MISAADINQAVRTNELGINSRQVHRACAVLTVANYCHGCLAMHMQLCALCTVVIMLTVFLQCVCEVLYCQLAHS